MHLTRRGFLSATLQTTIATSLGTGISLLAGNAAAAGGYELVSPPQNTSTPDKVEVVEYFWLGCPHCYSLEASITSWKASLPDHVAFVREAPPLNSSWEQHARGFYAAKLLGKESEFVDAMFTAIHQNGQRMRRPKDIAELASGLGMDEEKFLKTMESFGVQTKMNRAMQMAQGAGLTGVPAVVINGKYRTSASLAGGNTGIIDVINETVEMERVAMGL